MSAVALGLAVATAAFADGRGAAPAERRADARAAGRAEPSQARIYSTGVVTWIWDAPRRGNPREHLGYVRLGTSVALKNAERVAGSGCAGGFVAVEPRGYVCLDRTATLDGSGRYLEGMRLVDGIDQPLPYRYALSNGAPMYRRLPTAEEWQKAERFLGKPGSFAPLSWGNRGHEKLAEVRAVAASDPVPSFLADGGSIGSAHPLELVRRTIPLGSMLAFTKAFAYEGRTWLLSTDGTVVPADRVRPYRESTFHGTELGRGVALPIAWMRAVARTKYRRAADGSFTATGERWPARSYVELASAEPERGYLLTKEAGAYLAAEDATVVVARESLPIGVAEGEKWLLVSITQGTLVAYEGLRPVYATLISPGAGGLPTRGVSPVKTSSTPLGVYRVTFKHVAATMSPESGEDRSFWIADVPYTQYFDAPFALHVAYWHESFGEPMSAGCVNLSPIDGKRLFGWTDPAVPEGWNGAQSGGSLGKGTYVVVTR